VQVVIRAFGEGNGRLVAGVKVSVEEDETHLLDSGGDVVFVQIGVVEQGMYGDGTSSFAPFEVQVWACGVTRIA